MFSNSLKQCSCLKDAGLLLSRSRGYFCRKRGKKKVTRNWKKFEFSQNLIIFLILAHFFQTLTYIKNILSQWRLVPLHVHKRSQHSQFHTSNKRPPSNKRPFPSVEIIKWCIVLSNRMGRVRIESRSKPNVFCCRFRQIFCTPSWANISSMLGWARLN